MKIAALTLALLLLGGCSAPLHARQLENLQPVQTVGFDGAPGAVTVSVSDRKSTQDEAAVRMSAQGASVVRACEELQSFGARGELFFSHVKFALIGEDAAAEGISEVLDWFCRSTQTRLILPLFLVRGAEARSLVTGSEDEAYEITAILSALEEQARRRGEVHCFTVLDTVKSLNEQGAALCCALRPLEPGERAPSAEEGALSAAAAGYGVLRGDSLCGWLDESEARGATLLLGRAGEMSCTLPDGEGIAAVTLRSAKAALSPENGRVRASLRVTAGLTELSAPGELTQKRLHALESALASTIASECAAALEASARLRADFLGLGLTEEELREMTAQVRVDASISRSYDTAAMPIREDSNG